MEQIQKVEDYTFEKLLASFKRMYSRLGQLVTERYKLKQENTRLRKALTFELELRDRKIRNQANTLKHIHDSKRLQNSTKITNVSS